MSVMAAIFAIGKSNSDVPKLSENFSPEARNFVDRCLTRDQSARPSARQLLEHKFVSERSERKSSSKKR